MRTGAPLQVVCKFIHALGWPGRKVSVRENSRPLWMMSGAMMDDITDHNTQIELPVHILFVSQNVWIIVLELLTIEVFWIQFPILFSF